MIYIYITDNISHLEHYNYMFQPNLIPDQPNFVDFSRQIKSIANHENPLQFSVNQSSSGDLNFLLIHSSQTLNLRFKFIWQVKILRFFEVKVHLRKKNKKIKQQP